MSKTIPLFYNIVDCINELFYTATEDNLDCVLISNGEQRNPVLEVFITYWHHLTFPKDFLNQLQTIN